MRHQAKQFGQTRTRTKFLLFPALCQYEWRWLERATWTEKVITGRMIGDLVWAKQQWLDDTCHRARFGLGD